MCRLGGFSACFEKCHVRISFTLHEVLLILYFGVVVHFVPEQSKNMAYERNGMGNSWRLLGNDGKFLESIFPLAVTSTRTSPVLDFAF
jgi:hypothetical protein